LPLKRAFAETVIYELHLGGFTRHPNSGVATEKRGTSDTEMSILEVLS
jgi:isoamylase